LPTILEGEFSRLGLPLSSSTADKLSFYIEQIEHWNKAVNLTALSADGLVRRLIAEPAWIGQKLQMSGTLLDVGSGNGSPGVALFVSSGLDKVLLVEPRARRAAFLRHIASFLGPDRVIVKRARVEEVKDLAGQIDWVTFQGLNPSSLVETLRALLPGTTSVVWITTREADNVFAGSSVAVPGSKTIARVFRLDQF